MAPVKKILDDEGLFAEMVAPRLWEHPRTVDGGVHRQTTRANASTPRTAPSGTVDIARDLGCHNQVLWLAREGTYVREAKDAKTATPGSDAGTPSSCMIP